MATIVVYVIGMLAIGNCMTSAMARTFEEAMPEKVVKSNSTPIVEKPIEPPQPNTTCFYAEPELCHQFNESDPCKECRPHPVYTTALVCCNVTDLEKSISCVENLNNEDKTAWTHIHVRNATLDELDISKNLWKLLDSLAITDGKVDRIVKEFPKFSQPKCLNMSNNGMRQIPTRALRDLNRLQVLDLSHNNLSTIANLKNLNLVLDIRGNHGILCRPLLESIDRGNVTFIEPESTLCLMNQTFDWFNSTDTLALTQLEGMKQFNAECPAIPGYGNCTCAPDKLGVELKDDGKRIEQTFRIYVDCSGMGLITLPPTLPANTITLNISNNKITDLSEMKNPSYESIRRLYADDNQIDSLLDLEGTEFIQKFEIFHMRRNKLKSIPYYLLSYSLDVNPDGRSLRLEGNRLYCDCDSAKNLRIWLLARQNHIPDYDKVYCSNMQKKVMDLSENKLCHQPHDWTDYIFYLIGAEVVLLVAIVAKVSYDYWVFKTAGYLPWPASQMPKMPCDWLCET